MKLTIKALKKCLGIFLVLSNISLNTLQAEESFFIAAENKLTDYSFIKDFCLECEKNDTLSMLDDSVVQCYELLKNNIIPNSSLFETAYESLTRCGFVKLSAILKKACDILMLLQSQNFFEGTYTIIAQNTQEFCQKFAFTWTIIDGLAPQDIVIDRGDFTPIFTAINDVQQSICSKFNQTWTILGCFVAQSISESTTITQPGVYCLTQDITGPISIAASNVILDLNNHTISAAPFAVDATSQHNITIKNGIIQNTSTNGIQLQDCTTIQLTDLFFIDNATGLYVATTTAISLENCTFNNHSNTCIAIDSSNAITLHNNFLLTNNSPQLLTTNNSQSLNCSDLQLCNNTSSSLLTALTLQNSTQLSFENITLSNNQAQTNYVAALFDGCSNVTIDQCSINNNTALDTIIGFSIINNFTNSQNFNLYNLTFNSNADALYIAGYEIDTTNNINLENLTLNNNSAIDTFIGIKADSVDHISLESAAINLNSSNVLLQGLSLQFSTNFLVQQTSFENHTSSDAAITGFLLTNAQNGKILDSSANSNSSATGSCRGASLTNCHKITCNNITTSNLLSGDITLGVIGFEANLCTDIICSSCNSNNISSASIARGFSFQNCAKVYFNNNSANRIQAGTVSIGFEFIDCSDSDIYKNTTIENSSSSPSDRVYGFFINNSDDITLYSNISTSHTSSTTVVAIDLDTCSSIIIKNNEWGLNQDHAILLNSINSDSLILNSNNATFGQPTTSASFLDRLHYNFQTTSSSLVTNNLFTNNQNIQFLINTSSNNNCIYNNNSVGIRVLNNRIGIQNQGSNNSFFLNSFGFMNNFGNTFVGISPVYTYSLTSDRNMVFSPPSTAFDNIAIQYT